MALMPVNDAMFLLIERRQQPMHVGGLQLFEPPDGAGPNYVGEVVQSALEVEDVLPLFRRRAHRSVTTLGQWAWEEDRRFDLEWHVRHSALARPGRVRELLALASRLHGHLLDRTRPLWETHLIEGLEDGRFAVYTKAHHAMVDGLAAMQLMQDALSDDPDRMDVPPPWAMERRPRTPQPGTSFSPSRAVGALTGAANDVARVTAASLTSVWRGLREHAAVLPFQAPNSMFNVPITGARRFAAQSYELKRLLSVGKATGATINDLVLAMSAGALRSYLIEQGALPDKPLISMVPVALRSADEAESGNAVGLILCNLGTHEADPETRLELIRASMHEGKEMMSGLNQRQSIMLSALAASPIVLAPAFRAEGFITPPFNLVISNVPGPRKPLYWNGARMDGHYPLSIPIGGQALNITVTTYVDRLQFGLIGCRRTVPHLQRMLTGLEDALSELEKVAGV